MEIEQLEKILGSLNGISKKDWDTLKFFIDKKFAVVSQKNTLTTDESVLKNIMQVL